MDVEEVVGELYGLRPGEFVAARDAYAAEAREAGDREAARAIAALRRPTTAVWAANLLARRRPEDARRFLALGEALREAHRAFDAEALRTASRQRNQLVGALARAAAELAREEGQPVGDTALHEVEQLLHGVLGDPESAGLWARGRLARLPEAAVGFDALAVTDLPARPARGRRERPAAPPEPPARDSAGEREAERRRRERERERDRARAAAERADAGVRRRERELDEAREAQRAARDRVREAGARAEALERELHDARHAERVAREEESAAFTAVRGAEDALHEARRAAEAAARELRRLEKKGEGEGEEGEEGEGDGG